MEEKFWKNKWETNDIFFHQEKIHPLLMEFFDIAPGKVIVPLCGKSLDMIWLAEQGHAVIGMELSPIACEAFFSENKLPFQKVIKYEMTIYQGKKISIWCGDFFKVPASEWSNCVGLYDRAALIALPPEMRKQYAAHIVKILRENKSSFKKMLLISLQYPQSMMDGPPFSVEEAEVEQLYGHDFKIEKVSSASNPSSRPEHKDVPIFQNVYTIAFKR